MSIVARLNAQKNAGIEIALLLSTVKINQEGQRGIQVKELKKALSHKNKIHKSHPNHLHIGETKTKN